MDKITRALDGTTRSPAATPTAPASRNTKSLMALMGGGPPRPPKTAAV